MAVHVVHTNEGCYVHDDRTHLYLDAEGRWQVLPWHFASPQEALEAIRAKSRRDEFAIQ